MDEQLVVLTILFKGQQYMPITMTSDVIQGIISDYLAWLKKASESPEPISGIYIGRSMNGEVVYLLDFLAVLGMYVRPYELSSQERIAKMMESQVKDITKGNEWRGE